MKQIRKRLTYANVMSSIAVFLILGGATAFAATKIGASQLKANSVKTGKIVKEAVTEGKIKNGAVSTNKLAADAVTSGKLASGAVTSEKLGENAVTTAKIANGAVIGSKLATQYLPESTLGVPVAGVNVAANGTLRKWFNRVGGQPTAEKTGTGTYQLKIPGLEGQVYFNNSIAMVSLEASNGEISRTSTNGNPGVLTYNSAGAAADHEFDFVVFVPGAEP